MGEIGRLVFIRRFNFGILKRLRISLFLLYKRFIFDDLATMFVNLVNVGLIYT